MKRLFLIVACLGCLCGRSLAVEKANVVFILADDLGWCDTTLYGKTKFYRTPNLERLAKRGMTFTRGYSASPLCSPTRSAILTGLSPARTGITTPSGHTPHVVLAAVTNRAAPADKRVVSPTSVTRLKTEYRTLAEALHDVGYATGHFGKWHLGSEPYSALQQGFDVDVPHWHGPGPAGSYVAPWKFKNFDHDPDVPDQHIEDRMAKEAVAFIERHKDGPFFLNYWMFSVHAPFDAKRALIEKHRARVDPSDPQRCPTYAAMVESMDDAVGKLLDTLDRLMIADRTVVIFTADNGGNMYSQVDGTTVTSNAPLRGGKATLFEGGTRVPLVIAWPGITAEGSRSDVVAQSEDYFPTLLDGLGIKAEQDQRFDGTSLLPALKGESLPRDAVFQYFPHDPGVPDWLPPSVSVHRGDWKLIRVFHGTAPGVHRHLLFNLRDDMSEKHDLAAQQPDVVRELDALIEQFLARTQAVVPVPNPAFDATKVRSDLEGVEKPKGKTKAKGKDAAARGPKSDVWQASPDVELSAKAGELLMVSSGGDPWMSTRQLPANAKGPFTLRLRLKSSSKGDGLVYYSTEAGERFHKDRTVKVPIVHDGKFHDYDVAIPVSTLHALRLDPSTAPGEIAWTRIDLSDSAGKSTPLLK